MPSACRPTDCTPQAGRPGSPRGGRTARRRKAESMSLLQIHVSRVMPARNGARRLYLNLGASMSTLTSDAVMLRITLEPLGGSARRLMPNPRPLLRREKVEAAVQRAPRRRCVQAREVVGVARADDASQGVGPWVVGQAHRRVSVGHHLARSRVAVAAYLPRVAAAWDGRVKERFVEDFVAHRHHGSVSRKMEDGLDVKRVGEM
ncbi:hypothetical protein T492DRAFT_970469 [Pavlovales sp. CCMP2436]|nr:hypothetical protein T492DRAFT_970469 [Pavlovales sp. CCMP2436]